MKDLTTPAPERVLTQAERDDEAARLARASASGAMRRGICRRCGARRYSVCQSDPPGDHLQRWLDAYADGRISKDDLKAVIGGLVVIAADQLVLARRAA